MTPEDKSGRNHFYIQIDLLVFGLTLKKIMDFSVKFSLTSDSNKK